LEQLRGALRETGGYMAVTVTAANVRGIRPLHPDLLVAAVALVVIGVVFFASSHPLRGGVFVILAVGCGWRVAVQVPSQEVTLAL
jgi:hypothetical protein